MGSQDLYFLNFFTCTKTEKTSRSKSSAILIGIGIWNIILPVWNMYIQQSLQICQNSFGIQIGKANGLSQINHKTNTKITCFSIWSGFSIIPYAIRVIDSGVLGVPEHPLWIWKLRKEERKKNITIRYPLIYKANYGSCDLWLKSFIWSK